MSRRLVPAYVERAGWEVWEAFDAWLEEDDADRLRDAVGGLRDALLRGQAITYAPDDVVSEWLRS